MLVGLLFGSIGLIKLYCPLLGVLFIRFDAASLKESILHSHLLLTLNCSDCQFKVYISILTSFV